MSYILEALKRSQQERDLGHVPTLETPTFLAQEEGARPNLWIFLAVILASLAVVIALYSAMRSNPTVVTQDVTTSHPEPPAARETSDRDSRESSDLVPLGTKTRQASPQPASVTSGPKRPLGGPLAKMQGESRSSTPSLDLEPPATNSEPGLHHRARDIAIDAEESSSATGSEQGSEVPPDLVADIEAFKREVREEQLSITDPEQDLRKTALRDLRLPKAMRERLPGFVMSAHIYDSDPAKRFILINGLKTKEGEESQEGITVEQILPDGAVLGFEGYRFFQRR